MEEGAVGGAGARSAREAALRRFAGPCGAERATMVNQGYSSTGVAGLQSRDDACQRSRSPSMTVCCGCRP